MTSETLPSRETVSLRERKKQRTRRLLVDTAIELFGEHGYDAVTLDRLVDRVEVSQRTFFRMFASKEDVALDPERVFWRGFLAGLGGAPLHGPLLGVMERLLVGTVEAMAPEWAEQFLASRRIAEETPALLAGGLRFCAEATAEAGRTIAARSGLAASDRRLRLNLELMLAAWNEARWEWTAAGDGDTARLTALIAESFAALPAAMSLEA